MKPKQDAGHWQDVIERLRLDRADAVAAELAAARDSGAAALPATLGDPKAVARLAEADEREAAAGRRIKQLDAALADASGQLRAVQEAQREAEAAARLEAARGIALRILEVDRDKIGAGLAMLREGPRRAGATRRRQAPEIAEQGDGRRRNASRWFGRPRAGGPHPKPSLAVHRDLGQPVAGPVAASLQRAPAAAGTAPAIASTPVPGRRRHDRG
jgi:hypothetical protein